MKYHTLVVHYDEENSTKEILKSSKSKKACEDKAKELNKVYAPGGNSPEGDVYSIATVIDDDLKANISFN